MTIVLSPKTGIGMVRRCQSSSSVPADLILGLIYKKERNFGQRWTRTKRQREVCSP